MICCIAIWGEDNVGTSQAQARAKSLRYREMHRQGRVELLFLLSVAEIARTSFTDQTQQISDLYHGSEPIPWSSSYGTAASHNPSHQTHPTRNSSEDRLHHHPYRHCSSRPSANSAREHVDAAEGPTSNAFRNLAAHADRRTARLPSQL